MNAGAQETATEATARPRRRWLLLAAACLFALTFAQHPGQIVFDTKLDLVEDPWRFMSRALHLWDASGGFGQVQNQAIGYVFPMGPFFAAGHALGIPAWIVQRAWLGLLLSGAMWGMARLAAALGVGREPGWVVAGLAYALSPFFVGLIGFTSAAVLPAAVMPWCVLPLIAGAREGSPRRAAALSGLAIVLMGGVNATSSLCVLVPPALYIVTRANGPRKRGLMTWWPIAVFLASFWWLASLVFQGKYGLNVTTFTETPAVTESTTAAANVLRGTGNWLGYLNLGAPWVPASWTLGTAAGAILATSAVATAGLVGLMVGRFRERRFVAVTFVFGTFAIAAGYTGVFGGAFSSVVVTLLAGVLAPFRNIYKFEPVVAMGTALGLAALLDRMPGWRLRLSTRGAATSPTRRRVTTTAGVAGLLACIAIGALPFLRGQGTTAGGFTQIPTYWRQAAAWLGQHSPRDTALLVPASAFGEYTWGRPLDEPMQALEQGPWVARTLQPLGGVGNTRMLDDLEKRIVTRRSSPGMRAALARAGVRYIVARNDLDWRHTASPRPILVREALVAAGLRRVARFGPVVPEQAATKDSLPDLGIGKQEGKLHAIEIYAVDPAVQPVSTYAVAKATVVSGGPESIPQLADAGKLGNRATVLAADLKGTPSKQSTWVVSDALRRTRTDFGLVHDNSSYTLAAGENAAGMTSTPQLIDPNLEGHEAVALPPSQGGSVTASSYGSWLLQLPELQPANAFDRNPQTVWVAGDDKTSQGQWVQANLPAAHAVAGMRVRLLREGAFRPRVVRIKITTSGGSRITNMADNEHLQPVNVAPGLTTFVRVTLDGVVGEKRGEVGAGLRDVYLPGNVGLRRFVEVPEEPSLLQWATKNGVNPTFLFTRLTADPFDLLRKDEERQMRRQFTLPVAGKLGVSMTMSPSPGAKLDALLTRTRGIRVTATSSYGGEPRYRASDAFDGTRDTAWVAAPPVSQALRTPSAPGLSATNAGNQVAHTSPVPAVVDQHPKLHVAWNGMRTLRSVRVAPARGFAVAPTVIRIRSTQGVRDVRVGSGKLVRFRPLRADKITISFLQTTSRYTTGPDGHRVPLPVGVSEIDFPALRSQRVIPLPPLLKIATACGDGPLLLIDGQQIKTQLTTTAGAATSLDVAPARICGQAALDLKAGVHTLRSESGGAFVLSDVTLTPVGAQGPSDGTSARRARVLTWGTTHRTVRVSAGAATYLEVHENSNLGWAATMNGKALTVQQLDGWQQGFVVPAGAAGVVTLTYAPDAEFRKLLLVGLLFVLLLLPLALVPARRRNLASAPAVGAAADPRGLVRTLWGAGVIAITAAISWPVVVAIPVLCWVAARRGRSLVIYAGVALFGTGLITAIAQSPFSGDSKGAFGWPAQMLATLALAALMITLVPRRGAVGGEPGAWEHGVEASGGAPEAREHGAVALPVVWEQRPLAPSEAAIIHHPDRRTAWAPSIVLSIAEPGLPATLVSSRLADLAAANAILDARLDHGTWVAGSGRLALEPLTDELALLRTRFDLAAGPPLRVALSIDGRRLALVCHHAALDGRALILIARALLGAPIHVTDAAITGEALASVAASASGADARGGPVVPPAGPLDLSELTNPWGRPSRIYPGDPVTSVPSGVPGTTTPSGGSRDEAPSDNVGSVDVDGVQPESSRERVTASVKSGRSVPEGAAAAPASGGGGPLAALRRLARPADIVAPSSPRDGDEVFVTAVVPDDVYLRVAPLAAAAARAVAERNRAVGVPWRRVGLTIPVGGPDVIGNVSSHRRVDVAADANIERAVQIAIGTATPPAEHGQPALLLRLLGPVINRFSDSLLVSNLGRVDLPGATAVDFYPQARGRSAVAIGACTVAGGTRILTLRARDLTEADARALLRATIDHLR